MPSNPHSNEDAETPVPANTDKPEQLQAEVQVALAAASVRPGDRLVVGVSGGVDSVVLVDILHQLSGPLGLSLHVAHLDHGLRPDSAEDASFVAALSRKLDLPVTVEALDVAALARERGLSLEHAGREGRRDLWRRVQQRTQARWIVLGHHADDQAETVLLRLLRGTGITGLGAMRPLSGSILRPLLAVRRTDIQQYASERGLCVREDPSNRDVAFARNRVRHELLPQLKARHNPAVVAALNRAAHLAQTDDDYLEGVSRQVAASLLRRRSEACLTLDAVVLRGYHMAVQRRVLRQYIQELAQHLPGGFSAVELLLGRLNASTTGMVQVTGDIWAEDTGAELILRRGFAPPVALPLAVPGWTSCPGRSGSVQTSVVTPEAFGALRDGLSSHRVAFDARAGAGLCLRSPRPGDRLRPLGMSGHHKKLSDCFIDAKWPRILRGDALLLTRCEPDHGTEEVLWIPGLMRSESFRVTADTDSILYVEFVDTTLPGRDPRATS